MKNIDIELRDQPHLMDFEGSADANPTVKEIEELVISRGYLSSDIDIWFDDMFKFYRFSGKLIEIK